MKLPSKRWFFALPLLSASALASAWGPLGHEVVAEIAAAQLTPKAAAQITELFGDLPAQAMREQANWADEQRILPGLGYTAPYHYLNFPRGSCSYVSRRDCPGGRCIVRALQRFIDTLRNADSLAERRDAVRWVIHLVADIHQPLHAGYADDRGGNDLQLRWNNKGTNLHALLDSGLLQDAGLGAVAYARHLDGSRPAPPPQRIEPVSDAPVRWAQESCSLVDVVYPSSARIDAEFATSTRELLEQQLLHAGDRLAALLNATLR